MQENKGENTALVKERIIRRNGKIATLRVARKGYKCSECRLTIFLGEHYWSIVTGGGGLASLKFPDRTHVGDCLQKNLNKGGDKNARTG